ncbi:spermatogenesis-associated protein 5-like protein 1 [Chytriomyces hyalinus]|nr:spermatogenesis-associated protein 5-like protein 1 [Chytriomyces hyalinus]
MQVVGLDKAAFQRIKVDERVLLVKEENGGQDIRGASHQSGGSIEEGEQHILARAWPHSASCQLNPELVPVQIPIKSVVLTATLSVDFAFANAEHELQVCACRISRASMPVLSKLLIPLLLDNFIVQGASVSFFDGAVTLRVLSIQSSLAGRKEALVSSKSIIRIVKKESNSSPTPHSNTSPASLDPSPITLTAIPKGLEHAYTSLFDLVKIPLLHADLVAQLDVEYPTGVLLYGPPGVGKTMLVSTVARNCAAHLVVLNGSDVFGAHLGDSEKGIRDKFDEAVSAASETDALGNQTSCILFIDEIDSIAPNRNNASQSESRMVATLLTLMDGMKARSNRLIVIGATNRPNAIDAALRRPGRFDREIAIDAPNESSRLAILKDLAVASKGKNNENIMPLAEDVNFEALAISTNGYVGADLAALLREAWVHCLENERKCLSNQDFTYALANTTPSTTRGHAVSVPHGLTWDSVGGLEDVKLKLKQSVEWPITRRAVFQRLGLKPPRGILLYGPPGCSKTTLVRVIASTSNATFLSINGASLYSPFVGDSQQSVRALFQRARLSSPSVIFLDEIDAIVGSRDLSGTGGGGARDSTQESVLSTLLNEMDGIEGAKDVLVVGATNRPDMIDAALMRPGRFDKILYVPPPDGPSRLKILHLYSKGMPLSSNASKYLEAIASKTDRYTGADLESLCREAAFAALRESQRATAGYVETRHLESALNTVKPSLSVEMLEQYDAFSKQFGKGS